MPLSEEKKNNLDKICASNTDKEIIVSLKQAIESNTLTAKDVLSYTNYYYEENKIKRYALSPEVINQFGVFIGKYDQAIKLKFYRLAAERGSSYGNENYAKGLLWEEKYEEALPFAQQAVELTKTSPTEKHRHKFTLWKLLIANRLYTDAYYVLEAYIESKPLTEVEALYHSCISDLKSELPSFIDTNDSDEIHPKILYIHQLIYLIEKSKYLRDSWSIFYPLKQHLAFLKGQYAEKLGDSGEAWRSYCDIYDKTALFYSTAIEAKVRLLKDKVRSLLTPMPDVAQIELSEGEEFKDELEELSLPVKLNGAWKKEEDWFDSIRAKEVENSYDTKIQTLEVLNEESSNAVQNDWDEKIIRKSCEGDEEKYKSFMLLSEEEKRKKLSEMYRQFLNTTEPEENLVLKQKKISQLNDTAKEQKKKHLPEYRKIYRRHATEKHFFDPQRTKKQEALIALTDSIIEQRYQISKNPAPAPINLTGKSSRLFITAERIYQEAVIDLNGVYSPNLGIPRENEKPWSFGRGSTGYGAEEKYQVGNSFTKSWHRTSPKRKDRLGDSFLPQYGAYSKDIYPFLNKLCNKEIDKEKSLASWMIRYGKNHQSVSVAELQAIYPTATQADVDDFNHICFLIMEKEQMQWHSAVEAKYLLGMSVAQARSLILIKEGYLCFEEVFKNEVFFGVYSQKELLDHPERVEKACEHIEEMYTAYLQTKNVSQHMAFFKRNLKDKVNPTSVLTREQAHQDLKTVYGGESDTDDEGYESELSFS